MNNWDALISEYHDKIGKYYLHNDSKYLFFGLIHGDDDYYYGMYDPLTKDMIMASCVGRLADQGFEELTF